MCFKKAPTNLLGYLWGDMEMACIFLFFGLQFTVHIIFKGVMSALIQASTCLPILT